MGRESYKHVVSVNKFNYQPFLEQEPGPGQYNPKLKNRRSCTLKPRTPCDIHSIVKSPGPAAYENVQQFNADGTFLVSKFKRANAPRIYDKVFAGESKYMRFSTNHRDKPAPNQYQTD